MQRSARTEISCETKIGSITSPSEREGKWYRKGIPCDVCGPVFISAAFLCDSAPSAKNLRLSTMNCSNRCSRVTRLAALHKLSTLSRVTWFSSPVCNLRLLGFYVVFSVIMGARRSVMACRDREWMTWRVELEDDGRTDGWVNRLVARVCGWEDECIDGWFICCMNRYMRGLCDCLLVRWVCGRIVGRVDVFVGRHVDGLM